MSPVIETIVELTLHKLCECQEFSVYHEPCKCPNEGTETCAKCGRQCCDNCVYGEGLCITCGHKDDAA